MTYSFPCTDLSLAGKRQGMERDSGTRSGLLWEVERLLKETKELPDVLIMENVPQVLKANGWYEWCEFLENLGYNNYAEVINAKRFGIPQNRERCFMVSILGDYSYNFPKGFELKYRLKDMLEENVDEKYYLSDRMIQGMINTKFESYKMENKLIDQNGIANTIIARFEGTPQCIAVEKNIKTELCNQLIEKGIVKENDVIRHSYSSSRMNGEMKDIQQNNISPTLDTRCDCLGVVVKVGNYSPSGHNAASIVDSEGIAPTVMENHGTVTATVVNAEINPKLIGGFGEKKSNGGSQWYQQDRVYDSESVAMCHCANIPSGSYNYQLSDLRIRKLSPRECWRLMGVKDTDYNKITCSNAQKYKQAGNSIVTTCLMAIYSQLYKDCDYKSKIDDLLKELTTSNDDNKQINK